MQKMKIEPTSVFNKRILSFIPFKHVVVSTSLSLENVVELFSSSISPEFDPILNPLPNSKRFQGKVWKDGFNVRVTDYRQGSLTYVVGKFILNVNGVKIDMYVQPNPAFLIGPMFAAGLGACFLAIATTIKDYTPAVGSMIFAIIFGLGHILETDTINWFISNLIGSHIIENRN
jgi:hypothetical protein